MKFCAVKYQINIKARKERKELGIIHNFIRFFCYLCKMK